MLLSSPPKVFINPFRNTLVNTTADTLAPNIIPSCWLKKNIPMDVASCDFSTAIDRATNWDELSKPTPIAAGKIYRDSQIRIGPRHRSVMSRRAAMVMTEAIVEMTFRRLTLKIATVRMRNDSPELKRRKAVPFD